MHRHLAQNLEEIGLNEKESQVYIELLSRGSGTADEAAKATGLNRSTAYVIIKQLMDKGLVSQFKEGKKTKFNAESPQNLNRLIEAQEQQVSHQKAQAKITIPELVSIFSSTGTRPIVRYFEGKEGLTSVREEILNMKEKYYYAASSTDSLLKIYTKDELVAFSNKRAEKGIKVKLLYTFTGKQTDPIGNQEMIEVDEKDFPFDSDIYIYDNKVSFAHTSGKIGGIIIENAAIAKTMRSLFDFVWYTAEKNK